jgi:hypothetical protein
MCEELASGNLGDSIPRMSPLEITTEQMPTETFLVKNAKSIEKWKEVLAAHNASATPKDVLRIQATADTILATAQVIQQLAWEICAPEKIPHFKIRVTEGPVPHAAVIEDAPPAPAPIDSSPEVETAPHTPLAGTTTTDTPIAIPPEAVQTVNFSDTPKGQAFLAQAKIAAANQVRKLVKLRQEGKPLIPFRWKIKAATPNFAEKRTILEFCSRNAMRAEKIDPNSVQILFENDQE